MSNKKPSSKLKQRQIQTKILEDQTKKMQQKLAALKQQVQLQKKIKQASGSQSTVDKWKKITANSPLLKGYANKVLADRKLNKDKTGLQQQKKITSFKLCQTASKKKKDQQSNIEQKDSHQIPKIQLNSCNGEEQLSNNGKNIQINFVKAKINSRNLIQTKTLEEFLQSNYLQQYYNILRSNNVNTIEALYHMTKQQMNEIGITIDHQNKIVKRVKEQIQGKEVINNRNKQEQEIVGEKVSFGYGDGNVNSYQFMNQKQQNHKIMKQHQINKSASEKKALYKVDQDEDLNEQQDQVIITLPQMVQYSLQTNSLQQINSSFQTNNQFNCFQCYKKTSNQPQQSSDGRLFCGWNCLSKYLSFVQKQCAECHQIFYKFNGYFEEGDWFCSIKCSPNRQKVEEMFMQWSEAPNKKKQSINR